MKTLIIMLEGISSKVNTEGNSTELIKINSNESLSECTDIELKGNLITRESKLLESISLLEKELKVVREGIKSLQTFEERFTSWLEESEGRTLECIRSFKLLCPATFKWMDNYNSHRPRYRTYIIVEEISDLLNFLDEGFVPEDELMDTEEVKSTMRVIARELMDSNVSAITWTW